MWVIRTIMESSGKADRICVLVLQQWQLLSTEEIGCVRGMLLASLNWLLRCFDVTTRMEPCEETVPTLLNTAVSSPLAMCEVLRLLQARQWSRVMRTGAAATRQCRRL